MAERIVFLTGHLARARLEKVLVGMGEVGFNNNNIVFSYASRPTDIQHMFFTGVITRDELFAKNLPLVLAILAGLKRGGAGA